MSYDRVSPWCDDSEAHPRPVTEDQLRGIEIEERASFAESRLPIGHVNGRLLLSMVIEIRLLRAACAAALAWVENMRPTVKRKGLANQLRRALGRSPR